MRFTLIATPLLLAAASNAIPAGGSDLPPGLIPVTWKQNGGEQFWHYKCIDLRAAICEREVNCKDLKCLQACMDPLPVGFKSYGKKSAGVKCVDEDYTKLAIDKLGWTIGWEGQQS